MLVLERFRIRYSGEIRAHPTKRSFTPYHPHLLPGHCHPLSFFHNTFGERTPFTGLMGRVPIHFPKPHLTVLIHLLLEALARALVFSFSASAAFEFARLRLRVCKAQSSRASAGFIVAMDAETAFVELLALGGAIGLRSEGSRRLVRRIANTFFSVVCLVVIHSAAQCASG